MILVPFVVIWLVTFFPSWWLLLRLMAWSASDMSRWQRVQFMLLFFLYRLIIAAPYIYLVYVGQDSLPVFVQSFIVGFIVFGLALSVLRFFFKDHLNVLLWNIYAFVYDGLNHFVPYAMLQQKMLHYADPKPDMRILDLGCGTGNLAIMMHSVSPASHITAVDSSRQMLKTLRKKMKNDHSILVIQSDLIEYLRQLDDNSLDLVTMSNVLYTVTDRNELWPELLRVMRQGARAVITNSDRAGSLPLIKEHTSQKNALSLLRPSLVAVFVIDAFISELSKTGTFSFVIFDELRLEIEKFGGTVQYHERCYGGAKNGVNILFSILK